MIITGGVNIYPQEAENVLAMHPKVSDVAVFGVPNEDFGEEVKAVVQPVDMADAGPELERELIAYCREHLADVKCPRSVDFEAELPRHPTGKLYKRLLKDQYWQGTRPGSSEPSPGSGRRLADRGAAGEAVLRPVPPGDGVLSGQPAQPVDPAAGCLGREVGSGHRAMSRSTTPSAASSSMQTGWAWGRPAPARGRSGAPAWPAGWPGPGSPASRTGPTPPPPPPTRPRRWPPPRSRCGPRRRPRRRAAPRPPTPAAWHAGGARDGPAARPTRSVLKPAPQPRLLAE